MLQISKRSINRESVLGYRFLKVCGSVIVQKKRDWAPSELVNGCPYAQNEYLRMAELMQMRVFYLYRKILDCLEVGWVLREDFMERL